MVIGYYNSYEIKLITLTKDGLNKIWEGSD